MSLGWKGRDLGWVGHTWVCAGAPGGQHQELLSEPCWHSQVLPAVPGGHLGVSLGSVWAEASSGAWSGQPFIHIHPSTAQESQCPSLGCVLGILCASRRTLQAQLLPCKHQGQEVLVPFLGLPSFLLPLFPASWDTLRTHQGTFLAGSRSHQGLQCSCGPERQPQPQHLQEMPLCRLDQPWHSPEKLWPWTLRTNPTHFSLEKDMEQVPLQFLSKSWKGLLCKAALTERRSCICIGIPLLAAAIPIPGTTFLMTLRAWCSGNDPEFNPRMGQSLTTGWL